MDPYNDDKTKFKDIVNEVIEESILMPHGISDGGNKIIAFCHEEQLEIKT